MNVSLTTADFLDRGARVYAGELGVLDELAPPAGGLGALSYGALGARARALAAGLDALGLAAGERVAVVSHNSARMLGLFYAVPASGRVLVAIDVRLAAPEVAYIVAHSGARLLLVDQELDAPLREVACEQRLVLGAESDAALLRSPSRPWSPPDEHALASITYTSATTARPKRVALTHRNVWLTAAAVALHTGLSDRDVYLHTVPMFHANGWGFPFACAGLGVPQIVMRTLDGSEILRRVAEHGVTLLGGAPTVVQLVLAAAREWPGEAPGAGRVRLLCGGARPPTPTIARLEDELGWEFMQIDGLTQSPSTLMINRARPADRRVPAAERHDRLRRGAPPALGVHSASGEHGDVPARANHMPPSHLREPDDAAAIARADRAQSAVRAGRRRAVRIGVEALTASERRVAELAAEGLTNRAIAQALYVTESTIQTHLKRVFRKLAIRSRSQLTSAL